MIMKTSSLIITALITLHLLVLSLGCRSVETSYHQTVLTDGKIEGGKLVLLANQYDGYVVDKYSSMPLSMQVAFVAEDRKGYEVTNWGLVSFEMPLESKPLQVQNVRSIRCNTNSFSRSDRFFLLSDKNAILWNGVGGNSGDENGSKEKKLGLMNLDGYSIADSVTTNEHCLGFSASRSEIVTVGLNSSKISLFRVSSGKLRPVSKCRDLKIQNEVYPIGVIDTNESTAVLYSLRTNMLWCDFSSCESRVASNPVTRQKQLVNVRAYLANSELFFFGTSGSYGAPYSLKIVNEIGRTVREIKAEEKWMPSSWYWSSDGKWVVGVEQNEKAETATELVAKILIWDVERNTLRKIVR